MWFNKNVIITVNQTLGINSGADKLKNSSRPPVSPVKIWFSAQRKVKKFLLCFTQMYSRAVCLFDLAINNNNHELEVLKLETINSSGLCQAQLRKSDVSFNQMSFHTGHLCSDNSIATSNTLTNWKLVTMTACFSQLRRYYTVNVLKVSGQGWEFMQKIIVLAWPLANVYPTWIWYNTIFGLSLWLHGIFKIFFEWVTSSD